MSFFSLEKKLSPMTRDAAKVIRSNGGVGDIKRGGHIGGFFSNLGDVFRLIRQEPEILIFAVLQWACITLAYMGWVQALDWIPDSVWQEVQRANNEDRDSGFALLNLFLIGWSFIIVVCVSFPLSILTAGMVAVHALRHEGYESTFFYALWRGMRNVGQQWVFTSVDAWITVRAIFDRLPKKNNSNPRTLADEALYYAWKLATMGMVPAMIYGHGLVGAAKDSVTMIKLAPARAIAIRFGYSGICWIVGITTYIAAIIYGCSIGFGAGHENFIYAFYFYMTVPIFISVGIISVLVRPFFLLMVAKLYTDVMAPKGLLDAAVAGEKTMADTAPAWPVFFLAGAMLFAVLTAIFMTDDIGLTAWVENLAAKDFARMGKTQ
ncbi:MAG: hypothetical protein ACK4PK_08395 [Alphaproteobacteria bacterium]